jgi:tetratricopeptide (TPR) repeat protein
MFKNIPKIAVYLALFLIPLFSLPFTSNVLDFQKQFLLFIVASLGVFFWIWNALSEKKLEINLNPLHFYVGGFAVVALISSIFSLYSYGSLWGVPLPAAESFVSILSFVFLYFLIVNNFKKEDLYKLIAVGAISGAVAAVYAIIQSFGFYILPFLSYTKDPSFNTIGTISSLALYSAVILSMILPLLFVKKNPFRRLMIVCGAVLFLALVFFNGVVTVYFPATAAGIGYNFSIAPWIVLAISALATFVFSVSDQKFVNKNANAKNASFAIMFIAFLFLVFNIFAKDMMGGIYGSSMKALNVKTATEVSLQQRASAAISISVLKQSAQTFFLGSGPGTFVYDYVKYKPQSLSQDNYAWNIAFYAGASEVMNRIATTGLLGIISLLLIVAMWTVECFRTLTAGEEDEGLPLAIFVGWLAIIAAMFYYPFNFSLAMLFWIFLGLIIAMDEEKMVSLPLKSVRLTYAVTLIFIAVMVLELGLLVWNAKRYYAEAEYLLAFNALQKNNLTSAIGHLESAANSTDRLQDNYLTGLSQIYLAQARQELNKQNAKPEDAIKAASPYIQTAVQAAMLSTNIANPNSSANWAARGYVYFQLIGISDGFDNWAIDMFNKALSLEPNNPSLWTQLGQVYALKKDLAKARDSFNKAIALRPQLIDPHYYLAVLDDQQGDKASAIKELETINGLLPNTDQTSKDSVAKAIENLKEGKSLSGTTANSPAPTSGDVSQGQPVDNSDAAVSAPQGGSLENGSAAVPEPATRPSSNPTAPGNVPSASPAK